MLPELLQAQLSELGLKDFSEVTLREALETRVETYTLIKLAPWASRRWKCRYRLMMGDAIYDAQSAAEAYALGLQVVLEKPLVPHSTHTQEEEALHEGNIPQN
ncbi:MAG TPA: hypothetical protein VII61_01610 [Ktedonobacteraceae bacterium]|jgi:hypothetical protein